MIILVPDDGVVVGHLIVALRLLREWLAQEGQRPTLPRELEDLDAALKASRRDVRRQHPTSVGGSLQLSDTPLVTSSLLTYQQAAAALGGVSVRTVQRLVAAGALTKVTIGGRSARIHRDEVNAYARRTSGVAS